MLTLLRVPFLPVSRLPTGLRFAAAQTPFFIWVANGSALARARVKCRKIRDPAGAVSPTFRADGIAGRTSTTAIRFCRPGDPPPPRPPLPLLPRSRHVPRSQRQKIANPNTQNLNGGPGDS